VTRLWGVAIAALLVACGSAPASHPSAAPIAPMPTASPRETEPPEVESNSAEPSVVAPRPVPTGPASLSIHIPVGKRQPVALDGAIESIEPPRGDVGLDAWTRITVSGQGPKTSFYLLIEPPSAVLPLSAGDRLRVVIDCRKGGWQRVCDGRIEDGSRRVLAIVSGSGDDDSTGWKVVRGPVATSEIHPGKTRVVEHTHSLTFSTQRASVTALPHQWTRVLVHGRSYLVEGYETVWEGVPPPDARDHRAFGILLER
jgi:hypothetical protein